MDTSWDSIAEQFAHAIRRGESVSVDQFLATHGDAVTDESGELRALLESIAMIEGLKPKATTPPRPNQNVSTRVIKRLDDYKVIREIGRGGMGVVFEALHEPLGRRVAIKVFSASELADPRMLQRFHQEAQAAARLTHSNIVPVYGVGQCDSYHYYVMDLIDGMTAGQWIDSMRAHAEALKPTKILTGDDSDVHGFEATTMQTNSETLTDSPAPDVIKNLVSHGNTGEYFRCVARKIFHVCDALDYAHRHGTLHRDIKPANLIFDREGEIWVTDFGLAKLEEATSFTRTGDIVGTPQYMPPESFEGRYDERSEVYAVGLSLYEMLTQRPAIEAGSQAEAIRAALAGVTTSPRKWAPSIPRDLETITMKTLAMQPDHRYRSMRALKEDLHRFLHHRPITAKRTHVLERMIRWGQREPLAASLTAAVFVSLTALAVVSATGYFNIKNLLTKTQALNEEKAKTILQKEAALEVAEQQQVRATKNLNVAIEAFDKIVQNVADRGVDLETESFGDVGESTSPDVSSADAEMLQSLLGFFDELAANNSEDLRQQSAAALRRVGDIYQRLGKLKEADNAYGQALSRYREIAEEEPSDDGALISQAEILNEQANIAGLRAQVKRASDLYQQAVDVLSRDESIIDSEQAQFQYGRACALFASIVSRAGIEMPLSSVRQQFFRRPGFRDPNRDPVRGPKQTAEHFRAINEAISVFELLVKEHPDKTLYKVSLARAHRDKAKIAMRRGQVSDSRESINESIELFGKLLDQEPTSDTIRYEFTKTLCSTEALTFAPMLRLGRAMRLSNDLLSAHPEMARYRELAAIVSGQLADVHARRGDLKVALGHRENESSVRKKLIDDYPDRVAYQISQCQTLENMSDLLLRDGEKERAIQILNQAITLAQNVSSKGSIGPQSRKLLFRLTKKRESIE